MAWQHPYMEISRRLRRCDLNLSTETLARHRNGVCSIPDEGPIYLTASNLNFYI